MASANKTPLGYVELENGTLAIYPMNDIFLNYTFEDSAYWEALRLAVNLLIEAYRREKPDTMVKQIKGSIKVRTQYRHLLGTDVRKARDQDIKMITDEDDVTYVEFQNRANTNPPIPIRSVEYFGLGISHNKGRIANQIWLLAEDVDSVLHGKIFTRYILKDEITDNIHLDSSGILYVSLTKVK